MAELGRYNTLTVIDELPQGIYLDDNEDGRLLLPRRQIPEGTKKGDSLNVFVYLDSDDRPIATLQRPRVQLHQAAALDVKEVNRTGAFLDWGLAKDLFVPFGEMNQRMEEGKTYVVYVYLDNTNRLIATAKLNRFIKDEAKATWPGAADPFEQGDKVNLLIAQRTDLGYKAVVNNEYWGLIHESQIRTAIRVGQRMDGYVRRVREEDHRLDISLEPLGHVRIDPVADKIMKKLKDGNGSLGLNDKSPADLIELHFGVSKRAFKMAIGKLYKERQIVIEDEGIRLATAEEKVRSDLKPAPKTDSKKPAANERSEKQTFSDKKPHPVRSDKPTSEYKPKDTKKSEAEKTKNEKPKTKKTVYKNPKAPGGKTLSLKK
ncbi:S1 RNA-binding domain-containing protein [Thalassolituus sp.]|jgi:predicted RNA-binding protein (virulence factor B family)|uniref:CvfB family protein n=1 Tax=Thalassolituus sp. TaxID=2030822 RepID=UPI002A80CD45|nr:S1-like domain-containing RNA-binding protein [Thalassolituus sp.]